MVLEHGVQTQHGEVVAKAVGDALGLGESMADTAGAQHAERLDHHHLTTETGQRRLRLGVEPLRHGQFGCWRMNGHWFSS